MKKNDANIVEVLENGDVIFDGRIVSSSEFIVGTALCGLKNGTDEAELNANSTEEEPAVVSSESTDSGNSTPLPQAVKKRKVRFNPITLCSDDPRLLYARQYVEAINSSDPASVLAMLRELAIPKVVSVKKKLNPDPNFFLPLHIEIVGAEAIAATFAQYFIATPDLVIKLLNQRVHVYANGESCIECELLCCGTKFLKIQGLPEGSSNKVVINSVNVDNLADKLDDMQLNSKAVSRIEDEKSGKVLRTNIPVNAGMAAQESVTFAVETKFSMHLNVNKKAFLIITTTD